MVIESILDGEESQKELEKIKRCFWINLFNFKLLQKLLEIQLTKPRVLTSNLQNCTMFICLLQSIKVTINEHELNCYEIFRVMLKNDDLHFLSSPFEEPVRELKEFPIDL